MITAYHMGKLLADNAVKHLKGNIKCDLTAEEIELIHNGTPPLTEVEIESVMIEYRKGLKRIDKFRLKRMKEIINN